MEYFVECSCGKRVSVTTAMAGTSIRCQCTRSVSVPRLSELRQTVGQGAFEAGIVDTIRRMISESKLPSTDECVLTGRFTTDIAEVDVECERVWKRGQGKGRWAFVIFTIGLPFWPIWLLLSWALLDEKKEELGRETVVRIPLRVGSDQNDRLRRMSQRKIRRLLREIPVCAQLLDEYPGARFFVVSPKRAGD